MMFKITVRMIESKIEVPSANHTGEIVPLDADIARQPAQRDTQARRQVNQTTGDNQDHP